MHCYNCRSRDNDSLCGMALPDSPDVAVMTLCKKCMKLPQFQDLVVQKDPA